MFHLGQCLLRIQVNVAMCLLMLVLMCMLTVSLLSRMAKYSLTAAVVKVSRIDVCRKPQALSPITRHVKHCQEFFQELSRSVETCFTLVTARALSMFHLGQGLLRIQVNVAMCLLMLVLMCMLTLSLLSRMAKYSLTAAVVKV